MFREPDRILMKPLLQLFQDIFFSYQMAHQTPFNEIRCTKLEIRNNSKSEAPHSQAEAHGDVPVKCSKKVSNFGHWIFEFVSSFDIRISDLPTSLPQNYVSNEL